MLPDPYDADLLVPSGSAVQTEFTLVSLAGNSTTRQNVAADDGDPKVLKIAHSVVGKGASARDRHLVRMESYVVEDSVEDQSKPIALYAVADIPKSGVTAAQLSDLWAQFVGLLFGGSGEATYDGDQTIFFDRWLNGEA
jgi:hypothetical protein